MNKYSKPLVVFTAAASITFLAFSAVSTVGGPNWDAEAELLPDYKIEAVEGETTTWKVTNNRTGQAVSTTAPEVYAAAIIAARKDIDKLQGAEIARLNEETTEVKARLAEAIKLREADVQAMAQREANLSAQLDAVNKKILDTQNAAVAKSQEAQAIRADAEKRREDVYRLKRELEEIKADRYQALEHQKKLQDYLTRLEGVIGPLERRQEELEQATKTN